jgi:hypothetical protein
MSAFATAVPPAAVEAVCGGADIDAVEAVVRLADRSLAFSSVGADGRSRFGLLDTVREYGRVGRHRRQLALARATTRVAVRQACLAACH